MSRPGSLLPRFRTVEKAEEAAVRVVAALGSPWLSNSGRSKAVPKPSSAAVLLAGQLLDWHCVKQIPLSPIVLKALMCALRTESAVRGIKAAAVAQALAGQMSAKEIAEATGFSRSQIFAWRKDAPAYPEWTSDMAAVTAARAAAGECRGTQGEARRYPSPADALTVFGALRHFASRGLPVPEALWWSGVCAMGLADFEVGLLETTIEQTCATLRYPEALRLMAKLDAASDHAGKPRRSDAMMLRALERHFASQPRLVPKRSTMVRYRSLTSYEDHVAVEATYLRVRSRAWDWDKIAEDAKRRTRGEHVAEDSLPDENRMAWKNAVAAVKALDELPQSLLTRMQEPFANSVDVLIAAHREYENTKDEAATLAWINAEAERRRQLA